MLSFCDFIMDECLGHIFESTKAIAFGEHSSLPAISLFFLAQGVFVVDLNCHRIYLISKLIWHGCQSAIGPHCLFRIDQD